MKEHVRIILSRLKKPSVVLSVASQVVALLILSGVSMDETAVMTSVGIICSILATLGIMSTPETVEKGVKYLTCSSSGIDEPHFMVAGKMICINCGAEYIEKQIKEELPSE